MRNRKNGFVDNLLSLLAMFVPVAFLIFWMYTAYKSGAPVIMPLLALPVLLNYLVFFARSVSKMLKDRNTYKYDTDYIYENRYDYRGREEIWDGRETAAESKRTNNTAAGLLFKICFLVVAVGSVVRNRLEVGDYHGIIFMALFLILVIKDIAGDLKSVFGERSEEDFYEGDYPRTDTRYFTDNDFENGDYLNKDITFYCPYCDKKLEETFDFCPHCGNKLHK